MRRWLKWVLGVIASAALIFILLITAFEIAAYSNYGFYQKEYEKYQVLDDVQMEMDDVMYVTREMMAYLRGNRENLDVYTTVAGQERDFFNQREKDHMEDVMYLFLGGIFLRRIAIVLFVAAMAGLLVMKEKWQGILARSFCYTTAFFLAVTVLLGILFATDFTRYFTIFHELFFSNDLWLLDPNTDLLINILPEGFFMDMALRIVSFFVGGILIFLAGSVFVIRKKKD